MMDDHYKFRTIVRGQGGLSMFTIGKLANQAGVTVETVRFYQRNELLNVPEFHGKQRYYQQTHVRRLRFIKGAQAAGFSLKEIKQLLTMDASQDHAQVRSMARKRLQQLEVKMAQLAQSRQALLSLTEACESNPHEPCRIIAAFEYEI